MQYSHMPCVPLSLEDGPTARSVLSSLLLSVKMLSLLGRGR